MRRMLSLSSKQCAIGACIAALSLLSTPPALAQTGTGTKTAPSKPDPKKDTATKPAATEPKPADAQAPK